MPLNAATFEVTDSHLVSYYAQEADSPTAAGLHAHVTLNHFYTPYISAPNLFADTILQASWFYVFFVQLSLKHLYLSLNVLK